MFTGGSSEKLRIAPTQVQIDTTHFCPQSLAKSEVSKTRLPVNRTAVKLTMKLSARLKAQSGFKQRFLRRFLFLNREGL
jgi:hypothetical protein